ncbi:hypothetical protein ACFXGT_36620 [Streptomyces sp. NPDC059352]|uniref:hypothetical protein n=1 Tax=Streptomyces sp. NPDC059352 TaxID=3346810 RepID=UPI0036C7C659
MENLGVKAGVSSGIASLVLQFSAFLTILLGGRGLPRVAVAVPVPGDRGRTAGLFSITFVTDGAVTPGGVALVLFGAVPGGSPT